MPWGQDALEANVIEYEATVDKSRFVQRPDYRAPDGTMPVLLEWDLGRMKAEWSTTEPRTLRMSIGKGWQIVDKGMRVERTDGKPPKFNDQTKYGKLIARVADMPGLPEILESRGEPVNAEVWQGLRFHISQEEVDYGGEIGKKRLELPDAFIGIDDDGEGLSVFNGPTSEDAAKAAVTAQLGATELSPREQLQQLAQGASSFQTFIAAALAVPGVMDDKELYAEVANPEGFYATHSNPL